MHTQHPLPPLFSVRYVAIILVVGLLYFATAKFGFLLAFATQQVTAIWPPTAVALVAYILFGYRLWPGIFLGAFVANALSSEPLLTAAGIAIGNTLCGIVGSQLLRRWVDFNPTLQRLRDVLGLLAFGAALGAIVSASNGVAQLALAGIVPWSAFGSVWWVWWVGDAMGVLLLAPLLLTWTTTRPHYRHLRLLELGLLTIGLCAVSYLALDGQIIKSTALFRFEYAVFPFVIWAGLRFSQREAATAVLVVSAMAIWGAIHDRGPFATGTLDERLILLEVFMAITTITGLILGAATAERRHAEQALRQAHDDLELRVQQRTEELARTNRELAEKNEEVEAFVYTVSHDLRGPLVNLQGFSRELEASCAELQQRLGTAAVPAEVSTSINNILKDDIPGALHFITASTSKFERLIESLLRLSRYGRQEYRSDHLDIPALLDTTLDSMRQSITDSGASVKIVGPLPDASGDYTAIGQVFSNLIGNALKYLDPARPGQIEIGGEQQQTMAHYWVRDNGAGIPASAHSRLFQVFQRFHPQLAPGEGMGLAIVKRVVERHGGRIWADSQEGAGTTFHLILPLFISSR